ncbi:MAG: glycosyltransferase family 2 protein [Methylophilaceae bacterium]|mgnify:CR=1 FL=1|jgi:GT2 family glycosyltransferase|nr:glycosyltransferase family 2 protein [Methylophilaceae bacterium]
MFTKQNISIVLVTYNSEAIIRDFLLQAQLREKKNIIVVDNASKDKTVSLIKKIRPDIHIIQSKKNIGFGSAVNLGLTSNRSKYALVINPDTFLSTSFFSDLYEGVIRNNKAGLIAPTMVGDEYFLTPPNCEFQKTTNHIRHPIDQIVNFISGACFIVKPNLFPDRKIFDENIFMFYEDNDLSELVGLMGLEKIVLKDCIIYHQGESSSYPTPFINSLKNFHYGWSESYFTSKYQSSKTAKLNNFLSAINYAKRIIFFSITLNVKRLIPSWYRLKGKISFMRNKKAQNIRENF